MFAFEWIAEQRIAEAIARGDFDHLPGAGQPLELGEDPLAPPQARLVARILKNSGFVPLEILERREIATIETELPRLEGEQRVRAVTRLALLRERLGERRARRVTREPYARRIVERLAGL